MKDMPAQLEKLHTDAAECALIRDLATDPKKRELFTKLADHLMVLASEVERAIADSVKHTGRSQAGGALSRIRWRSHFPDVTRRGGVHHRVAEERACRAGMARGHGSVFLVVERGGPTMLARIGVMPALNRRKAK
ncbi:hypothetical protein [Bradyrhizobium japonicum]|uniref:hypothetical protein n=1 Tax=Bradyrhizobium japonicum TaxID=375 RepID=UPI0027152DDB|nr:hypothetical protein [Bradyrhizobium japonicum]WLB24463.1 hypothetical protein QIH95_47865 [Bradyrhizobium japonicum]